MSDKTYLMLVYSIMCGLMLAFDAPAGAIVLAIFFHAFYTTHEED